jgi:hypothetical protein
LPHLSRSARIEAIVEYVTSGSRVRLFLPKESSLITFLLSGMSNLSYLPWDYMDSLSVPHGKMIKQQILINKIIKRVIEFSTNETFYHVLNLFFLYTVVGEVLC